MESLIQIQGVREMAEISDVVAYLCKKYPHKSELSKTRVSKLVYLADWESAKKRGYQITGIQWYFDNFGPYKRDVVNAVRQDERFSLSQTKTMYGDPKLMISLSEGAPYSKGLSDEDMTILDKVIKETAPLYWDQFIKHVYSTPPISHSDRYQPLDLENFLERER